MSERPDSMRAPDLCSVPNRGVLRRLASGIEITRATKHEPRVIEADAPITKIAHAGGGDFDFHTAASRVLRLDSPSPDFSFYVYQILQTLAMDVQLEWLAQCRKRIRAAG